MDQRTNRAVIGYHAGLNIIVIMLFIRGVLQVTAADILSHGMDAAISGIAGIGHLALGVSMIMILLAIKKNCEDANFG